MCKICISLEISNRDYMAIVEGTKLLNNQIAYQREAQNKSFVHVDEQYFVSLAIRDKLFELQNSNTANFN